MKTGVDFDDWMSGRNWLKDKAPAEGFYGRYSKQDLELMKKSFTAGANNELFPFDMVEMKTMSEDTRYNVNLSYEIGRRLNEK